MFVKLTPYEKSLFKSLYMDDYFPKYFSAASTILENPIINGIYITKYIPT